MSGTVFRAHGARICGALLFGFGCVATPASAAVPGGDPSLVGNPSALASQDVGSLVNRASSAGLVQRRTQSFSAVPVDFDRDGDQDVWIGKHAQGAILWRNDGSGHFSRVATSAWPATNQFGKVIDRHDCAWADVDRNGRPDAYCSTGRFLKNVVKRGRGNELWLQSRQGRFSEHAADWHVRDLCGRGRFVAFLNANGDRWPDLFVGNTNPRKVADECNRPMSHLTNEKSKLFLNLGGRGFRYAPRFLPVSAGPGTGCAEVLDYDGDGDDDLLLCRRPWESPVLFQNVRHERLVPARMPGLHDATADATSVDFDEDGDLDVITASGRRFDVHLNSGGILGPGSVIGRLPDGNAKSVAGGDADNDGDLDVFGVAYAPGGRNPRDFLWINTGDPAAFVRVPAPAVAGTADQVVSLHRGPIGVRDEFLVLNGGFTNGHRYPSGPVQLLRLVGSGG